MMLCSFVHRQHDTWLACVCDKLSDSYKTCTTDGLCCFLCTAAAAAGAPLAAAPAAPCYACYNYDKPSLQTHVSILRPGAQDLMINAGSHTAPVVLLASCNGFILCNRRRMVSSATEMYQAP
jgi:hypothetical protein